MAGVAALGLGLVIAQAASAPVPAEPAPAPIPPARSTPEQRAARVAFSVGVGNNYGLNGASMQYRFTSIPLGLHVGTGFFPGIFDERQRYAHTFGTAAGARLFFLQWDTAGLYLGASYAPIGVTFALDGSPPRPVYSPVYVLGGQVLDLLHSGAVFVTADFGIGLFSGFRGQETTFAFDLGAGVSF